MTAQTSPMEQAIAKGVLYQQHKQKSMEAALSCGDYLILVKQQLPHGSFQNWLERAMPVGATQCRKFMKLAANRDSAWRKQHSSDFLGITAEAALISIPDDDALQIREWAVKERPNQAEILAAIKKIKKPAESPKKIKVKSDYPLSKEKYIDEARRLIMDMRALGAEDSRIPPEEQYKTLVDTVNKQLDEIQETLTEKEIKALTWHGKVAA